MERHVTWRYSNIFTLLLFNDWNKPFHVWGSLLDLASQKKWLKMNMTFFLIRLELSYITLWLAEEMWLDIPSWKIHEYWVLCHRVYESCIHQGKISLLTNISSIKKPITNCQQGYTFRAMFLLPEMVSEVVWRLLFELCIINEIIRV